MANEIDTDLLEQAARLLTQAVGKDPGVSVKKDVTEEARKGFTQTVDLIWAQNKALEKQKELIEETYSGQERAVKLREVEKQTLLRNKEIIRDTLTNGVQLTTQEHKRLVEILKQQNEQLKQQNSWMKEIGKNAARMAKDTALAFTNIEKFIITPQKMVDVIKRFDDMSAAFAKATGAGRKFSKEIEESKKANDRFGTSLQDSTNNFKAAYTGLIGFGNQVDSKFIKKMTDTGIVMDNLGVPFETFYKNVNSMSAILGVPQTEAAKLEESLVSLANGVGMTVADVNTSLMSNMNRLSIYGNQTMNQFAKLQQYARATNLEVSTLTDLNERLSTFEGAGDFAGGLNAILGQDLFDVGELVGREGADKTEYIINQLQKANLNLDDPKLMRAVTQRSGIDAATIRSLINLSGKDLRDQIAATDKAKGLDVGKLGQEAASKEKQADALAETIAFNRTAYEGYLKTNDMLFNGIGSLNSNIVILAGTIGTLAASIIGSAVKDKLFDAGSKLAGLAGLGTAAGAGTGVSLGSAFAGSLAAGAVGLGAAGFAGWKAGRYAGEEWGIDNKVQRALDWISGNENMPTVEDGAIVGGRPIIASAGKMLRGSSTDIPMLVDPTKASSGTNNNQLLEAIKSLASRPVIVQIDGKEIARVAHGEFTPRMMG